MATKTKAGGKAGNTRRPDKVPVGLADKKATPVTSFPDQSMALSTYFAVNPAGLLGPR
jgi:hypothetical protein